jgi:pimeloyl-ACP methyl ester carboxylesterase
MRHLVDVGGAELEAVLEGQGSLTVVFENGLATPLEFRQICPPNAPPGYRAHVEERLLSPTGWAVGLRTTRAEGTAIPGALRYLRRECPALPAVPIHVLTAGGVTNKAARRVHEAWRVMAARGAHARYTDVPTSGHYMPIDAPEAVVQAISGVLESSRRPFQTKQREGASL